MGRRSEKPRCLDFQFRIFLKTNNELVGDPKIHFSLGPRSNFIVSSQQISPIDRPPSLVLAGINFHLSDEILNLIGGQILRFVEEKREGGQDSQNEDGE